jgi:hypothetical protein
LCPQQICCREAEEIFHVNNVSTIGKCHLRKGLIGLFTASGRDRPLASPILWFFNLKGAAKLIHFVLKTSKFALGAEVAW